MEINKIDSKNGIGFRNKKKIKKKALSAARENI